MATRLAETAEHATPEEIKKHLGKYYVVFVALLCLTAITVGVSYLKLNRPLAITIALIIATVKAGMVAGVFMHLISEKKVIYAVLILTAAFFLLVLLLPSFTTFESTAV
jgi:cytochrome c oxidase subunit IV